MRDGLLARPVSEAATPMEDVLRALEAEVLSRTGVPVVPAGKTLDGGTTTGWAESCYAPTRPDSGQSHTDSPGT